MGLFDLSKLVVSAIDNLEATLDSMVETSDKVVKTLEKVSDQAVDVSQKVVQVADKANKASAIVAPAPKTTQTTSRSINGIERKTPRVTRSAPPRGRS